MKATANFGGVYTVDAGDNSGAVVVSHDYYDWADDSTSRVTRTFVSHGRYVHEVFPNGSTSQACEGLAATGPTLMTAEGESLEAAIRRTLA